MNLFLVTGLVVFGVCVCQVSKALRIGNKKSKESNAIKRRFYQLNK